MENPIFRCSNFPKLWKSEFRYPHIFQKMSTSQKSEDDITKCQNSSFFSNNPLDPLKIVDFFADHFEYWTAWNGETRFFSWGHLIVSYDNIWCNAMQTCRGRNNFCLKELKIELLTGSRDVWWLYFDNLWSRNN